MLLQFNMTNAMSFKEEAILDMVAEKDNLHEDNLISFKGDRVLPAVAIYGANASGKSNVFMALASAILFVRTSMNMQVNSSINIMPFLMDNGSIIGKTRFDFIFTHKGIKYEYGFVTDIHKVYQEYLYEYKSAKASMIFEREDVNKYRYTKTLRKTLKQYEDKNTDNKLFLATATAWNCKETTNPFLWFAEGIDVYNKDSIEYYMAEALDHDTNDEIRDFAKSFLRAADINISDYKFTIRKTESNKISSGKSFDEDIRKDVKLWDIEMHHDVETDGEKKSLWLPYELESNGTRLLFAYSPVIYNALKNGKTVVIDEIDNGLHPVLIQHLVEIFNNKESNPNGAQLIFNTHDVQLLNLDIFRRDQIYFVEKDNRTGASELYALSDFSPRKTEKIRKGYMLGRYGAIPDIGELEW